MVRITWTEPDDSRIRPGHESVMIAPWTRDEAIRFADELIGNNKIEVRVEEI